MSAPTIQVPSSKPASGVAVGLGVGVAAGVAVGTGVAVAVGSSVALGAGDEVGSTSQATAPSSSSAAKTGRTLNEFFSTLLRYACMTVRRPSPFP